MLRDKQPIKHVQRTILAIAAGVDGVMPIEHAAKEMNWDPWRVTRSARTLCPMFATLDEREFVLVLNKCGLVVGHTFLVMERTRPPANWRP